MQNNVLNEELISVFKFFTEIYNPGFIFHNVLVYVHIKHVILYWNLKNPINLHLSQKRLEIERNGHNLESHALSLSENRSTNNKS